jgi:hypothetical protein
MSKIDLNELNKFTQKQLKVLRKAKNDLDLFAYSFVTARELKVIDRVLTKIKNNNKTEENINE